MTWTLARCVTATARSNGSRTRGVNGRPSIPKVPLGHGREQNTRPEPHPDAHLQERRRLPEALPAYAAPDQDVYGVDM